MEENKNESILIMVMELKGLEKNPDQVQAQIELTKWCESHKMTPVAMSQFKDYLEQVAYDKRSRELFNEIKTILMRLEYPMTFEMASEVKRVNENNENVAIDTVKALEEAGVQYRFVSTLTDEFADIISQTVKSAGTRAFNKASSALRYMAYKKFGEEFNMKHARDFMKEQIEESAKKNEEKVVNS